MKILVTGSNGFIGRYICQRLQLEHEVIGLGTKPKGYLSNIEYIQADIEKPEFVTKIKERLKECYVIIHAAACIDMNPFNDQMIDINCKGTNHVMQLAKETGCRQLIHISSLPVIGFPSGLPITEEHLPKPNSLYHISKLTAEHIINQGFNYGIKSVNLRITSPIGAGMNEKTLLPILLKRSLQNQPITIYGRGLRKQNYIDVRDIAEAVARCVDHKVDGIYNIAAETVISNIDLARLCIELTNSDSQIFFEGREDPEEEYCWKTSIVKAKESIGFQQQYTLQTTIMDILDYWNRARTV